MSTLTFANTHNMVAFLEKRVESDGFHKIIDFLNANQIHYALTVNPTIYTSCIEQLWATAKAKTINGERQLQALVDKKNVILTETSIRSDLHLEDAGGIDCLPTATIFEELARMGVKTTTWNEFSSTMASAIICLATNQNFNLSKYIFDAVRKQTKNTEVPHTSDSTADVPNEEHVPKHSHDPLLSGENRLKLIELMDMCTKLSKRVLDLEHTKTAQAQEITNLKLRVKKLEKKAGLRTHKFKRLYKVGVTRRVASLDDEGLGAQEDASKQGRKIDDLDSDAEVTLVDETQEMNDDNLMFDTNVLEEQEKDVAEKETLIEIKAAKPKVVTSAATTTTTTRPKARGVVVQEPSEFKTTSLSLQASQLPQDKDKGKGIMVEPEVPVKKKDQLALDEEMARNLEAQLQAELTEEE
ncbi:hypothetical protein Tco_1115473, partial [Tanacetum coccineum]